MILQLDIFAGVLLGVSLFGPGGKDSVAVAANWVFVQSVAFLRGLGVKVALET